MGVLELSPHTFIDTELHTLVVTIYKKKKILPNYSNRFQEEPQIALLSIVKRLCKHYTSI